MKNPTKAKDKDQFVVRLPDGMRDQISEAATRNNRSMNAEIVARLEESFLSNVSARFKWALAQVNEASHEPISVSKLAEAISEKTAEQLERVFGGAAYPTFDLSDRVAKYLNVRPNWLKHGEGAPYEVQHVGSYGIELAHMLAEMHPEHIAFIRSMAREGNVAIVVKHQGFISQIYKTTLNLSEVVGGSGEYDQISFSNTCRKLNIDYSNIYSSGYLTDPESYVNLVRGNLNPCLAIKNARPSNWFLDWWDPSTFENQENDNGYWIGYRDLCLRVYRNIDTIEILKHEFNEIMKNM